MRLYMHMDQFQYILSSGEFSLVITDNPKHKKIPRTSVCLFVVKSHLETAVDKLLL